MFKWEQVCALSSVDFSNRRQFVLIVVNYMRLVSSWMVGCNAGIRSFGFTSSSIMKSKFRRLENARVLSMFSTTLVPYLVPPFTHPGVFHVDYSTLADPDARGLDQLCAITRIFPRFFVVYVVTWPRENDQWKGCCLLLPTSQPSEEARRQHYRALRKYCAGGKNLEWSRDMFVR